MGYFRGKHIPDYFDPFWEERDLEDHEAWFHLGYETGFSDVNRSLATAREKELETRIEQLESLIAANYRVMKEELKAQFEKQNQEQVRDTTRKATEEGEG